MAVFLSLNLANGHPAKIFPSGYDSSVTSIGHRLDRKTHIGHRFPNIRAHHQRISKTDAHRPLFRKHQSTSAKDFKGKRTSANDFKDRCTSANDLINRNTSPLISKTPLHFCLLTEGMAFFADNFHGRRHS
jgi:hypothetical protein